MLLILALVAGMSACGSDKMAVKNGDNVSVEYKGTLEDGTVFDSSEGKEPLSFVVGSGQLIKGFDEAVVGMSVNDEKDITLNSQDAYGESNPQLVQKVPRSSLPKSDEIKEGMVLVANLPDGQQIPGRITKFTDDDVFVDFNHPLAGKVLNFHIKLLSIN